MSEWREVRLADLVEIKHGFAFKGEFFRDEPTENFLMTPGNFAIGGGFQWGKGKYYLGPVPDAFVLSAGDIVVTMTDLSKEADTLGYGAVVPKSDLRLLHNQRIGKVLTKSPHIDPRFVHWVLRTRDYRNEILANYTGSTVKHTSPSKIGAHTFRLPPLPEQQAIAAVLGALDDKIELNRRMNRTLEAMARALFRSWFVDFDPVRAKAEGRAPAHMDPATADLFPARFGEDGLPEGWRRGPVSELVEFNPRERLGKDEVAPYFDMKTLPTTGPRADAPIMRAFTSGTKFRNGDVLLARITPCLENGKTALVDSIPAGTIGWGSTEFIVMRGRGEVSPGVVYCLARNDGFRECAIQSMVGSSGRQRVQNERVETYEIAVPAEPIFTAFAEATRPQFALISANGTQIDTLAVLRDTLLPKLMSGELSVRDAERELEEVH